MYLKKGDRIFITTIKGNKRLGIVVSGPELKNGKDYYSCLFGKIQASVGAEKLTKLFINKDKNINV